MKFNELKVGGRYRIVRKDGSDDEDVLGAVVTCEDLWGSGRPWGGGIKSFERVGSKMEMWWTTGQLEPAEDEPDVEYCTPLEQWLLETIRRLDRDEYEAILERLAEGDYPHD